MVQVLARDATRVLARALAENVYRKLRTVTNQTLGTVLYFAIETIQPPFLLDVDQQKARPVFAFNCRCNKVPS